MKKPVLLIIFNRPETTKKVFEKISDYKPDELFIAADGPRKNVKDEREKCLVARSLIDTGINWDCKLHKLYRDDNLGCKLAVSGAIDWFFSNVDEGIVLEDDCLPSRSFFLFCEEMLRKYRNNEKIMHVSGDNFQPANMQNPTKYYFSRYAHVWGWASWARAWKMYDVNASDLKNKTVKQKLGKFTFNFWDKLYWNSLFKAAGEGKIDTWDYQWVYSCWKAGGLSINPGVNLVKNIGFGSDATHTTKSDNLQNVDAGNLRFPVLAPEEIFADDELDSYTIKNIFKATPKTALYLKLKYDFLS